MPYPSLTSFLLHPCYDTTRSALPPRLSCTPSSPTRTGRPTPQSRTSRWRRRTRQVHARRMGFPKKNIICMKQKYIVCLSKTTFEWCSPWALAMLSTHTFWGVPPTLGESTILEKKSKFWKLFPVKSYYFLFLGENQKLGIFLKKLFLFPPLPSVWHQDPRLVQRGAEQRRQGSLGRLRHQLERGGPGGDVRHCVRAGHVSLVFWKSSSGDRQFAK